MVELSGAVGDEDFSDAKRDAVLAALPRPAITDGLASSLAIDPWTSARLTLRAVRDLLAARFGRAPIRVPLTRSRVRSD